MIVEFERSIARLPLAPAERLLCFWTAFFVWSRRRFTAQNLGKLWALVMDGRSTMKPKERDNRQRQVCLFGHFGSDNFGNEITLQTILHHLRRRLPEANVTCICTGPEALRATQNVKTVPISPNFVKCWRLRTRLARSLRGVFIEVLSELWRGSTLLENSRARTCSLFQERDC